MQVFADNSPALDFPPRSGVVQGWSVLPRIGRGPMVAALGIAVVALVASLAPLPTETWNAVAQGRWLVEHRALPASDPLVASTVRAATSQHEWLAQCALYAVAAHFGGDGLLTLRALAIAATAALAMVAAQRRAGSARLATWIALAAMLLIWPALGGPGPQLLGMAAFAALLVAISPPQSRHALPYWLPLLFLLWANCDRSAALGLTVLACWLLGRRLDHRWRRIGNALTRRDLCLTLAVVACAGCAPLGLRGLLGWGAGSPLSITSPGGWGFAVSLALLAIVLRCSPAPFRLAEALPLLLVGAATATHAAWLPIWSLTLAWALAPHALRIIHEVHGDDLLALADTGPRTMLNTGVATGALFAAMVWSPPLAALISGNPRPPATIVTADTPFFVAQAVRREDLVGNCFAPRDWSGYLTWQSGGKLRPLLLNEAAAPLAARQDDQALASGTAAWLDVVDHRQLRYLVIDRARHPFLHRAAVAHPRSRVVYEDRQGTVLEIRPPAVQ